MSNSEIIYKTARCKLIVLIENKLPHNVERLFVDVPCCGECGIQPSKFGNDIWLSVATPEWAYMEIVFVRHGSCYPDEKMRRALDDDWVCYVNSLERYVKWYEHDDPNGDIRGTRNLLTGEMS